jgi:hypothetical protein
MIMANYIDTRDLATELDELEERQALVDSLSDPETQVVEDDTEPLDEEETERLEALRELRSEIPDWSYGETMIPVDDFEEYAEELAEDIGAIDREARWPLNHIDWKAAARELSHDYTEVTLDGVDYYVRAS